MTESALLDNIKKLFDGTGGNMGKLKQNKTELAKKMAAYAATALSALTVAQPASAAIVYSGPQNLSLDNTNLIFG